MTAAEILKESEVQRQIMQYLTLRGIFFWRNNSGVARTGGRFIRFGTPGSPDIVGILPSGRLLGIECKADGGRISAEQMNFIAEINSRGGLAFIARSVHDVERYLEKI